VVRGWGMVGHGWSMAGVWREYGGSMAGESVAGGMAARCLVRPQPAPSVRASACGVPAPTAPGTSPLSLSLFTITHAPGTSPLSLLCTITHAPGTSPLSLSLSLSRSLSLALSLSLSLSRSAPAHTHLVPTLSLSLCTIKHAPGTSPPPRPPAWPAAAAPVPSAAPSPARPAAPAAPSPAPPVSALQCSQRAAPHLIPIHQRLRQQPRARGVEPVLGQHQHLQLLQRAASQRVAELAEAAQVEVPGGPEQLRVVHSAQVVGGQVQVAHRGARERLHQPHEAVLPVQTHL
jgi:hypothetical protein